MFKKKKLFLFITFFILAVFIAAAIWQWNNIQALILYLNNDSEQLEQKLQEEDEAIRESLDKLTQETEEEAKAEEKTGTEKEQNKKNITQKKTEKDYSREKARINELINEVYYLREYYTSQLDSMHETAMYSFWDLPHGQRTMEVKREMAYDYIDSAIAMERQCDAKMTAILEELKGLLVEIDGDKSTVSDISYLYAQEKQIKKAQLMNILAADPQRN